MAISNPPFRWKFKKNFLSNNKFGSGALVSLFMLALCFVLSQLYWSYGLGPGQYLAASPSSVFDRREYWRLLSTLFVHGDMQHLLSNSLMFLLLAYFVVSHYGVWVFPVLGLMSGALVNLVVLSTFRGDGILVGMSGVIYFLWGFWLLLYLLIERHVAWGRRLMKVSMIGLVLLVPTTFEANVSYLSHGLGFGLGLLLGATYFFIRRRYIRAHEEWLLEIDDSLSDHDRISS